MPVALVPLALAPVVAFAVPFAVLEAGEAVFVGCAAAFVVAADPCVSTLEVDSRYETRFTCVLTICSSHQEAFEVWE